MEPLTLLTTRKKSGVVRTTKNSRLFKTIIHAIQEKKGENIVSLDLRKIHEAVADFFIICEGSNPQQLRAIGEFVQEEVKKQCGEVAYKHDRRTSNEPDKGFDAHQVGLSFLYRFDRPRYRAPEPPPR